MCQRMGRPGNEWAGEGQGMNGQGMKEHTTLRPCIEEGTASVLHSYGREDCSTCAETALCTSIVKAVESVQQLALTTHSHLCCKSDCRSSH